MLPKKFSWKHYLLIFCLLTLPGTANARSVTITWQDTSDNEQGFFVERTLSNDCSDGWEVIAYTGINQTLVTDVYKLGACYRAAAYNQIGTSAYSNVAQVVRLR